MSLIKWAAGLLGLGAVGYGYKAMVLDKEPKIGDVVSVSIASVEPSTSNAVTLPDTAAAAALANQLDQMASSGVSGEFRITKVGGVLRGAPAVEANFVGVTGGPPLPIIPMNVVFARSSIRRILRNGKAVA